MLSASNYLFWTFVTHLVPQIGFFASVFFGSILLVLNSFGTRNMFGSYKYLINAFTLLGMAFATMEILVYPNVHNYKAAFYFFSFQNSFGLTGPLTKNIPLAAYTWFYAATVSLLSVLFIYRYWSVFNNGRLKFFKGWYWFVWVAYSSYFGFQYSVGAYYFLKVDKVAQDYLYEEIRLRYNASIYELPAMSLVAYDQIDGSVRWFNLMGVFSICSIVTIQYGVMIYCGWFMYTKMENQIKNYSAAAKTHHKQFFKSLVLQITAPTLILFTPITIIIFLPVFNFDVSFPSGVMLCSFTLYPAMDSFIVMYVVTEYRRSAKRIASSLGNYFKGARGSRNEVAAISNGFLQLKNLPSNSQPI